MVQIGKWTWNPEYVAADGGVVHADFSLDECPTGYVTAASREWVRLRERGMLGQNATGSAVFGKNLSKWPALAVDVFGTLHQEEMELEDLLRCRETRRDFESTKY